MNKPNKTLPKQTPPKQGNINIGIDDVLFLEFQETDRVKELKQPLAKDAYEFEFNLNSQVNADKKQFNILLSVNLFEKQGKEKKVLLANIKTFSVFRIVNFEEVIIRGGNNTYSIPDPLLTITSGLTISSARGMLVMLVKDTILKNAIIPIIDPKLFLQKKE